MVPTMNTEAIRFQQTELVRRAEQTRRRRESHEQRSLHVAQTYPDVVRMVDEANVAARLGLVQEASRLLEVAFGAWARPRQSA